MIAFTNVDDLCAFMRDVVARDNHVYPFCFKALRKNVLECAQLEPDGSIRTVRSMRLAAPIAGSTYSNN